MLNDDYMNYWVITSSEDANGPYECEEDATLFASANILDERWTITTT